MSVFLTVLFADISGSTRLYEQLGNATALEIVSTCLGCLATISGEHEGTVIKTIGDEIMVTFPHPAQAVSAALAMQAEVNEFFKQRGINSGIRIGLNTGPVLQEGEDVFGDAVNVAARMVQLAKSGQILTTAATVGELPPHLKAQVRLLDYTVVKGRQERVEVHEVVWQPEEVTYIEGPADLTLDATAHLKLQICDRQIELYRELPPLTIGRSPHSDIVIDDERASREHARVEFRRGKFVLVDQSRNGTFVTTANNRQLFLKREEYILQDQGRIGFGRVPPANDPRTLHYWFVRSDRSTSRPAGPLLD